MSTTQLHNLFGLMDIIQYWIIISLLISCCDSTSEQINDRHMGDSYTFQNYLTARRETQVLLLDLCPPPSDTFNSGDCGKPFCNSTSNCSGQNESCCFNGCLFTCLQNVGQPPVILDDTSEEPEIECSTSGGRDMYLCPNGYTCLILNRGDPLRAIPNRGVCVSLKEMEETGFYVPSEDATSHSDPDRSSLAKEAVYLPGGCFLTTEQYFDIEEFIKGMHFTSCLCSAGSVVCSVPPQKGKHKKRHRHG